MFEAKTIDDNRDVLILTNQNTIAFMLQVLREHEAGAAAEYDKREAARLHQVLGEALDKSRKAWQEAKIGQG